MREERITVGWIARQEGGHPARVRIFLVLEQNREITLARVSQLDRVTQNLPLADGGYNAGNDSCSRS